jgi:GNAT superfamily N-acetyltransferase
MRQPLSNLEAAALVERAEAEAYAAMFAAAPPDLGLTARRFGSAVMLLAPRIDVVLFNRVLGLGVDEPATEDALDAFVDVGRREGGRSFGFALSPRARPASVPSWLEARGFRARDNWVKMIRAAEDVPSPATELRIERIDAEHAAAFGAVPTVAFRMPEWITPWNERLVGLPGLHGYAAFDGDALVAVGALYVRGDVGWIGVGATLPSHRNRGAQSALLAARIRGAAGLGCRWVATETGEETPNRPNPSYRNMVRAGFALVYARPNFQAVSIEAAAPA